MDIGLFFTHESQKVLSSLELLGSMVGSKSRMVLNLGHKVMVSVDKMVLGFGVGIFCNSKRQV